jgi:hypothetical protein
LTVTSTTTPIEQHPDIVALRMRYERAAETPTARILDGLCFLTGLYLTASPWILGYNGFGTLAVTNLVMGIAMVALALGFASAFGRTHGVAWIAPVIGAWTAVAPWVVAGNVDTTKTITNNLIAGGLFLLLSLGAIAVGMRRPLRER